MYAIELSPVVCLFVLGNTPLIFIALQSVLPWAVCCPLSWRMRNDPEQVKTTLCIAVTEIALTFLNK